VITTGEGGMVTTADDAWADRMRRLRDHGSDVSAWARHASSTTVEQYVEPGFNFRLSDLLAAVGLVQLERLDAIVTRRRELAAAYHEQVRDLPLRQVVGDPPWGRANYQSFWVELAEDAPVSRDDVLARLFDAGVLARRGIMAAHLEPAFADTPHAPLPVTERLTARSLILPLFHSMTELEQQRVVDALRAALV
jgi:perosamine synthetase